MSGRHMRVVHTISSLRTEFGGPSRSVTALCTALAACGPHVHLLTTRGAGEGSPVLPGPAVALHVVPRPSPLRLLWPMRGPFARALRGLVGPGTLVHDHGMWLPIHRMTAAVARTAGVPYVVSIRGMLSAYALGQKRGKKGLAWHAYQRRVLNGARLIHATSEAEAQEVRAAGISAPVVVVPNGVEAAPTPHRRGVGDERTALFLARLHPKKGLPDLVQAWAAVRPAGWRLVVAGPDEGGHRAEVERLVAAENLGGAVSFVGEVNDQAKWGLYASADLFVLPTHSENFGITVAEALTAGVPVVTTHGAPWAELPAHGCGWWVPVGAEAVAHALREATGLSPDALAAMGERGRSLVAARYAWPGVAARLVEAYAWALGEGPPPESLYADAAPMPGGGGPAR